MLESTVTTYLLSNTLPTTHYTNQQPTSILLPVPGTYLNDMADQLTVEYNTIYWPTSNMPPIFSSLSEIETMQGNVIITSRLPHVLKEAWHADVLKTTIIKQTVWVT